MTWDRGEFIEPEPLASGKTLVLAPEDPERYGKHPIGNRTYAV